MEKETVFQIVMQDKYTEEQSDARVRLLWQNWHQLSFLESIIKFIVISDLAHVSTLFRVLSQRLYIIVAFYKQA